MIKCTISELHVPFLIPRRGKGHSDISSECRLSTSTEGIFPEDFLSSFFSYQKKVLTHEVVREIGETVSKNLNLNQLHITIKFFLPLERLSPSFEDTIHFDFPCYYDFFMDQGFSFVKMTVECPVRVKYISILKGVITLGIRNPRPNIYFEDLLDVVQRYGNTIIYPLSNHDDINALQKEIDSGKEPDDYLNFLRVGLIKKDISEGGSVHLNFYDLYHLYNIEKGVTW